MARISGPASDPDLIRRRKNQLSTTGPAETGVVHPRITAPVTPYAITEPEPAGNNAITAAAAAASGSTGPTTTSTSSSTRTSSRKPFTPGARTLAYQERLSQVEGESPDPFTYDPFRTSKMTNDYTAKLAETEGAKPSAFQSRYEGAVQSILNGILTGQKPFNPQTDINYQMLYDQARESYMNAGQKAMRDNMGAAQAATGGYGSTAAQIAGAQAYDSYLQGLNDRNQDLTQLAYQMYRDQQADRYNQLNAVQGLDDTDYQRWVQDYNNWLQDRGYYAGQRQQSYANDRSAYESDRNLDYNVWSDELNRYMNDRAYYAGQAQNELGNDLSQYQFDTEYDYREGRDQLSDYDDAFSKALSLAQNGITSIPAQYANRLEPETLAMLQGIAGQALAAKAAGGSGGGGGRGGRRRGSGKSSSSAGDRNGKITVTDAMDMMTNIAATEGPDAARDLAQSMLNTGDIITTPALREPIGTTLARHAAELGKDQITPFWKQSMDNDLKAAAAEKTSKRKKKSGGR